ncbi:hypothetical protein C8R44DRAFT_869633 [Mycena epipterygia]|nr:hypothetical protein C8R44DRAFT_869633 [Mycena epipterygia]
MSLPSSILTIQNNNEQRTAPFLQRVQLLGPNGEVVCATAQVDDGAMKNCISKKRWDAYGHCLTLLAPTATRIRVASGGRVTPMGKWWGEVEVGGVRVQAWFEVFECGGVFDVILGKPWLHAVRGIHDYDADRIHIRAGTMEAVIGNEGGGDPVEGPETEQATRERVWQEEEEVRMSKKVVKKRERKEAQLERRAEQPLPFPGLGYSPPQWTAPTAKTPRPYPTPKTTAPEPQIVMPETRTETDPEQQLEEEAERLNLLWVLEGPWTETRFAKYLEVHTRA